jgi:hypothetical protein
MLDKPDIERLNATVKANDPMLVSQRLGIEKTRHRALFGTRASKEPQQLRPRLRWSVQRCHELFPGFFVDQKFGPVGKHSLRSLAASLDEKLR